MKNKIRSKVQIDLDKQQKEYYLQEAIFIVDTNKEHIVIGMIYHFKSREQDAWKSML